MIEKELEEDALVFAVEDGAEGAADGDAWKLLIVDDEEEIHRVTKLALSGVRIAGRSIEFVDAYTGAEAVDLCERVPDIALVLMDVVMENDHAGLDAVSEIRQRLGNEDVRIVLRTGQPGQAPEREVVTRYDINDYKEKTELTAKKMFTLVYTAFSLYSKLRQMRRSRRELECLLDATASVLQRRHPERLIQGVLGVLISLLGLERVLARTGGLAVRGFAGRSIAQRAVVTAAGTFTDRFRVGDSTLPGYVLGRLDQIPRQAGWFCGPTFFAAEFKTPRGDLLAFYIETEDRLIMPEPGILDLLHRNVSMFLLSSHLYDEVENTQRELVCMLSEAVEERSHETRNHVRRVGEFARLLGRLAGLDEAEGDLLLLAAPLHDVGKIGIPDAILNKPGRLTTEERMLMERHASIGEHIFVRQNLPVLKAAAIIAGQHHEKWDGSGYPRRLAGEDIHLYGRVVALADVFDALASPRCYKPAWPMQDVLDYLRQERGRQFDPRLVDLLLSNVRHFVEIRERLLDSTETGDVADAA